MFIFCIFFKASGVTEAVTYSAPPAPSGGLTVGATAYTTASPGWPQHIKEIDTYLHTYVCILSPFFVY